MARPRKIRISKQTLRDSAKTIKGQSGKEPDPKLLYGIVDFWTGRGVGIKEAWEIAGLTLQEPERLMGHLNTDIVKISEAKYSGTPRNEHMPAVKTEKPQNGHSPTSRKRKTLPSTDSQEFAAIAGRALMRWRQNQELSVPEAAKKLGMNITAFYKIESGLHQTTTAINLDFICEKLGMHVLDFLDMGK